MELRYLKHKLFDYIIGVGTKYPIITYAIASGLFFLVFFHSVLGNEYVFIQPWHDQARVSAPFLHFIDQCYDAGILPLWNPYQYAGMPFAANGEAGAFYLPLIILTYIMDSPQIFGWFGWLHMWVGWLAMFVLLKDFKFSSTTAVTIAIGYVFSGIFVLSAQKTGHYAATVIWIPLMILILRQAANRKTPFHVIFLALTALFQVTAGILMYTLPIGLLLLMYSLYLGLRDSNNTFRWRPIIVLLKGVLLGTGLAAFQILLNFEMFLNSQRLIERISSHFIPFSFSLWWEEWPGLERLGSLFYPISTAWKYIYYIPSLELGILCLWALGLFLLFKKRLQGEAVFWIWASFWYLSVVFLNPLLRLIEKSVPIVSSIHIFTIGFHFWAFACCLSAGFILEGYNNRKYKLSPIVIVLFVFAILIAPYTILSSNSTHPDSLQMTVFLKFILNSLIIYLLFLLFEKRLIPIRYFRIIFSTVIISFATFFAYNLLFSNYMKTPREYFPLPNERIEKIKNSDNNNYWRVLPIDTDNLYPNAETLYEIYGVNGFFPMYSKRYFKVLSKSFQKVSPFKKNKRGGRFTTAVLIRDLNAPLLDLLGVKYALRADGELNNNSVFPRCWFSNKFVMLPEDSILDRIGRGDFNSETVLIEEDPSLNQEMAPDYEAAWEIIAYEPNRVEIEVTSNSHLFFTLSDNYYPGWHAYIDGKKTKLFQGYYLLRTIIVPEGRHKIEFIFEPRLFYLGLMISGITMLFLIIYSINLIRIRKKISKSL